MSNDLFKKYRDLSVFEDPKSVKECFNIFDKDGLVKHLKNFILI